MSLPDQQVIDGIIEKLGELIDAMEAHPLMTQQPRNPTIYFTWDFVQRSRQMLRDLPKVQREQGRRKAKEQFSDAIQRTIFSKILINDTTGKLAIMTGGDPRNPVDFGEAVKQKAEEVERVLPQTI